MVIKCIVQARIASKRLPGKVLKKIRNKEILLHIVEKLKRSKDIKKTIVATSTSKSDDKIEFFCKKKKLNLNMVSDKFVFFLEHLYHEVLFCTLRFLLYHHQIL